MVTLTIAEIVDELTGIYYNQHDASEYETIHGFVYDILTYKLYPLKSISYICDLIDDLEPSKQKRVHIYQVTRPMPFGVTPIFDDERPIFCFDNIEVVPYLLHIITDNVE
jgi:hypothetical protein